MKTPTFIMVDGIDGSGKTTMLHHLIGELSGHGAVVFDLARWCKEHHRLPSIEECGDPDILISAEPTHAWIGAAIRNEFIRNGTTYSVRTIAEAFALDRLVLYERIIIPLRRKGTLIVQDRGITTSLVYQAGEHTGLSLIETVMMMPGNALAIEHAPNLLIIADCQPETAINRLAGRSDKNDDSVFERIDFLRIVSERFRAPWFRELWESRGTKVVYLDANRPREAIADDCISLARSFRQPA